MASTKPQPRKPRSTLSSVEAAPAPSTLRPSPDNGVGYADRKPSSSSSSSSPSRRGRQLGHRIPDALYERLAACADDTGIAQQRLIIRAIETELAARGF